MAEMSLSIPDTLKAWAEKRVAEGAYPSVDDYIRSLMESDKARELSLQRLQDAIDVGLASGKGGRSVEEIIAARRG